MSLISQGKRESSVLKGWLALPLLTSPVPRARTPTSDGMANRLGATVCANVLPLWPARRSPRPALVVAALMQGLPAYENLHGASNTQRNGFDRLAPSV